MAQFFKHSDGLHYGSIPTLPIVSESYAFCVDKSIGYIETGYKYIKLIGQVTHIVTKDDPQHRWWEIQNADGYVAPKPGDSIVVMSFPEFEDEIFLLKDIVHVTHVSLN